MGDYPRIWGLRNAGDARRPAAARAPEMRIWWTDRRPMERGRGRGRLGGGAGPATRGVDLSASGQRSDAAGWADHGRSISTGNGNTMVLVRSPAISNSVPR